MLSPVFSCRRDLITCGWLYIEMCSKFGKRRYHALRLLPHAAGRRPGELCRIALLSMCGYQLFLASALESSELSTRVIAPFLERTGPINCVAMTVGRSRRISGIHAFCSLSPFRKEHYPKSTSHETKKNIGAFFFFLALAHKATERHRPICGGTTARGIGRPRAN